MTYNPINLNSCDHVLAIGAMASQNFLIKRDAAGVLSPVRTVPRSRRNVTGFFSWRGVDSIQYESPLERDFLTRQEFSLAVLSVVSQPCQVPFTTTTGRRSHYTPDFLVGYRTNSAPPSMGQKPMLVEVKPEADWRANWRLWLPKWKAARQFAISQGWTFRIMDESRIRTQSLANIQFLRRYRNKDNYSFPEEQSAAVISSLRELGSASFDYLLAKHFPGIYAAEGVAHLWSLLATRRLDCDIYRPLSGDTELWVPDEV